MSEQKVEVSLYQLTTHPLEKVLPRILQKVYEGGMRALVVVDCQERMQVLNASLWTYSSGAFLPHAMKSPTAQDPMDHPIWLTLEPVNENKATVIVLVGGQAVDTLDGYDRCVDIFDGNDLEAVAAAHKRRENYHKNNHPITYWKQSLDGSWTQNEDA